METTSSKDRGAGSSYIAFFDLDRTLTRAISGKELMRAAIRKGLIATSDVAHAIYLLVVYKLNLKDPVKIMNDMIFWVKGMPEKTMTDLCSEVFHRVLLPSVYDEARSEIKFHKDKNAKVVILSSALIPLCNEIAKSLGLDDVVCSDLEVRDGYLTGCSVGQLCFGKEKMIRLSEYCEKNNKKTSDAWYYGDSISDLAALSSVGNAVCINPDRKLRKAAIERGWKILFWNS